MKKKFLLWAGVPYIIYIQSGLFIMWNGLIEGLLNFYEAVKMIFGDTINDDISLLYQNMVINNDVPHAENYIINQGTKALKIEEIKFFSLNTIGQKVKLF